MVFINICIDNKKGLWKKYVESKGLKGYNIICNENQARYLQNLFMVNSIPQYTLIGEDGKFLLSKTNSIEDIEKQIIKIK